MKIEIKLPELPELTSEQIEQAKAEIKAMNQLPPEPSQVMYTRVRDSLLEARWVSTQKYSKCKWAKASDVVQADAFASPEASAKVREVRTAFSDALSDALNASFNEAIDEIFFPRVRASDLTIDTEAQEVAIKLLGDGGLNDK